MSGWRNRTRPRWKDLRDGHLDLSRLEEVRGWLGRQPGIDPQTVNPPDRHSESPCTVRDFLPREENR